MYTCAGILRQLIKSSHYLLLLIVLIQPLYGQDDYEPEYYESNKYQPEFRGFFQFYSGYETFSVDDAYYAITTGGDLDWSQVGTRLVIDQVGRDYFQTIGLRFGLQSIDKRANQRHNLFLDFATNSFIGPVYLFKAGIGWEPEFHRKGSPLAAFMGIGVGISHIWATIGSVGGAGDIYLENYDGEYFYEGSEISMRSDALLYASISMGAKWYFAGNSNIFAQAGYRFSEDADVWHYRIVNSDDPEAIYEFPLEPSQGLPTPSDSVGCSFELV